MGGPAEGPEAVPAEEAGAESAAVEMPAAVPWMTPDEVQAMLRQGDGALEDGYWDLAIDKFLSVYRKAAEPRWTFEGGLRAAEAMRAAGRLEDEGRLLDELGAAPATSPMLETRLLLERSQWHGARGEWKRAQEVLETIRDTPDPEAKIAGLMLEAAIELKDWEAAEAVAEGLTRQFPESATAPRAWVQLAARMADGGNTEEAHRVLQRVALKWENVPPWGETAELHDAELSLEQDRPFEAVTWSRRVEESTNWLAATRAKGFLVAARAFMKERRHPEALAAAQKAEELADVPDLREKAKILAAQARAMEGELEPLEEIVHGGKARNWLEDLQLQLAEALKRQGRNAEALEEYQAWLEAHEGEEQTVRALLGKAETLVAAGRTDEAAQTLERAESLTAGDAGLHAELLMDEARLFAESGHDMLALAKYRAIGPEDSENAAKAKLLAGDILVRRGDTTNAEKGWLELSRQSQWKALACGAMQRLGKMYEKRGSLEAAIEQYGRLADIAEKGRERNRALMARGLVRYRMGSFQGALEDFMTVQAEAGGGGGDEDEARALYMGGWCLEQLGELQAAQTNCEEFISRYPDSPYAQDVYFWLGEKEYNAGHYQKAEEKFLELTRRYPDASQAAEALYWAGRAAMAQHENLRANEHFNEFMRKHPEHPRYGMTQLAQGDVLSELGDFPQAIMAFEELITRFPQTPEAQMARGRKGDCLFSMGTDDPGRYEEAFQTYQTLIGKGIPLVLRLNAMYKSGRCLEKAEQPTRALAVYADTMYVYLTEKQHSAESTVWFTKAAFDAAALQEKLGDWQSALKTYQHVVDAGVPAKAEAEERIHRILERHGSVR